MICLMFALGGIVMPTFDVHAAVVARGNSDAKATSRISVSRAPASVARMPSATTPVTSETSQSVDATEPEIATPEPDEPIIENKSDQFAEVLGETSQSASDTSSENLAESIRRQRAALDAADAVANASSAASGGGAAACEMGLRECMADKCGKDFTKCATDGDTMWGDKMDACRTKTKCTANEYTILSAEIKADRDMNVRMASYNAIIECGNSYNSCIEQQCGTTFTKCLGKSAMDAAISACDKVAKNCVKSDSGLAGRTMEVIGTLRQDAEKQVQDDEKRLYALRDQMRSQCELLGAAFDERTFDCVFTVNFYANNSSTPYATRRAYAGNTFNCTQDWFGVDVTTFKENAARLTRQHREEIGEDVGDNLGTAVGMVASGQINRAIERQKADNAVKKAKKEATNNAETVDEDKSQDEGDNSAASITAADGQPKDTEEKTPVEALTEQRAKQEDADVTADSVRKREEAKAAKDEAETKASEQAANDDAAQLLKDLGI